MSSDICLPRLRKELRQLQKKPVDNIRALAKESNLLEWHYVLEGTKGSSYEGGYYHGVLTFPAAYPFKPPSIMMLTPNGRFKTGSRLCLSMSDFHPETWDPMWSVGTILLGLYSFMHDNAPTLGSMVASDEQRGIYARESLAYNCKNKEFCELFPELKEAYDIKIKEEEIRRMNNLGPAFSEQVSSSSSTMTNTQTKESKNSIVVLLGLLMTVVACTWLIVFVISF